MANQSNPDTPSYKKKNTILIVDDQPDIRKLIRITLEHYLDADIVEAIDGEDGWLKYERFLPDLVVLDVMMPGIDGLEVCERIRNHSSLAEHTKIILLSGRNETEYVAQGLKAVYDAYLPKTCGPVKLLNKVEELLNPGRNQ